MGKPSGQKVVVEHLGSRITVSTSYIYPPIPERSSDWSAVDDSTYDGEGCPVGYGPTEQDAIDDLLRQLWENGDIG